MRRLPRFNWFLGVFLPTFLTIIGVIFFLRLGFIVGNVGILGAILILIIAESNVFATAFSICYITRKGGAGPGGAFSLISRSLGFDVGGAVGIPLMFALTFSTVFYLFGFAEAWQFIFPQHSIIAIGLAAFFAIFVLVFVKLRIALKSQIVIFAMIIVSLLAIVFGGFQNTNLVPFIQQAKMPFWKVFAVFFPAITGILAGIGLSGRLKNARKDIPRGIIVGLVVTFLIYMGGIFWLGFNATSETLIKNKLVMIELSGGPYFVLIGILAATFASALVSFFAASRLLYALAYHKVVPFSKELSERKKGQPRKAIITIAMIVVLSLFLESLNKIAMILTAFFLITYAIINYATLTRKGKSWICKTFAVYGILSSALLVFLISWIGGLFSVMFIIIIYLWIKKIRKAYSTPREIKVEEEAIKKG